MASQPFSPSHMAGQAPPAAAPASKTQNFPSEMDPATPSGGALLKYPPRLLAETRPRVQSFMSSALQLPKCPLCQLLYHDPECRPRMLNCDHTVCEPCLETLAAGITELTCPVCPKGAASEGVVTVTEIGPEGVAGLRMNQEMLDLAENSAGSRSRLRSCPGPREAPKRHEGKLYKLNRFRQWQPRHCTLEKGVFTVCHEKGSPPSHVLRMSATTCTMSSGKKGQFSFKLRPHGHISGCVGAETKETLEMKADNVAELTLWVNLLTAAAQDKASGTDDDVRTCSMRLAKAPTEDPGPASEASAAATEDPSIDEAMRAASHVFGSGPV